MRLIDFFRVGSAEWDSGWYHGFAVGAAAAGLPLLLVAVLF